MAAGTAVLTPGLRGERAERRTRESFARPELSRLFSHSPSRNAVAASAALSAFAKAWWDSVFPSVFSSQLRFQLLAVDDWM